jgi:hypothetical protein
LVPLIQYYEVIKKITTLEHVSLTRVSDEDGKGLKEIHMILL